MNIKNEHWYNHGWATAIGSVLLTLVLPTVWDLIMSLPFLTSIKLLVSFFTDVLATEVKVIWLIAGLIILSLIIRVTKNNRKKSYAETVVDLYLKSTPWLFYRAGKFEDFYWKWVYKRNKLTNAWEIKELTPTCPTPDCEYAALISNDKHNPSYACPLCGKEYWVKLHENTVLTLINNNIAIGQFTPTTRSLPDNM